MTLRSLPNRTATLSARVSTVSASTNRIRGRALQRINAQLRQEQPLCAGEDSLCERDGIVTIATQTDHKVALVNGGTDTHGNRQRLCDDCHRAKTRRDMALASGGVS